MQQEYAALNLHRVFALLRRNLLALLLCAILGAEAAAFAGSLWLPPQYQATALLLVDARSDRNIPPTGDQMNAARQMVNTYAVLLTGDDMLSNIIQTHQMEDTVISLRKRITAQAVEESQVLRLTVRDKTPSLALAVLQSVVDGAPGALGYFVGGGAVEVVSPPRLEEDALPWSGQPRLMLLGAATGFLLCVAWLFIREMATRRFVSEQDVETRLGLPVLGSLPPVRSRTRAGGVLAWQDTPAPAPYKEGTSSLCTSLRFLLEQRGGKVLLVTSAAPREGKSSVVVNVAQGLAQAGKRVLVVEGNLRKPALQTALRMAPFATLQDALAGDTPCIDCVYAVPELGIWVLPAGREDDAPAALLGGKAMQEVMEALSREYDVILLDSPPAAVADAAVLSRLATGVLLVLRHRGTSFGQAALARRNLDAVGAEVLGVVYNECDVGAS